MKPLTIVIFAILAIFLSCDVIGERGNGNVTKQERHLPDFNAIEVSGSYTVYLSQGTTQSVIVEADDNLQALIKTEVEGNVLHIFNKKPIMESKSMKVYITVVDLKSIDISGAVDIETQMKIKLVDLSIDISGAVDGKLELEAHKIDINSSGGCKLLLKGTASVFNIDASGAVKVHAFDLITETCSVNISGAGKAEINVVKELTADISGAGSVLYKGNPPKVSEDVSGAGSVKKVE